MDIFATAIFNSKDLSHNTDSTLDINIFRSFIKDSYITAPYPNTNNYSVDQ